MPKFHLPWLATRLWAIALLGGLAAPASAAPAAYLLQPDGTVVGFATDFGEDVINGQFPITGANLQLDFNNPGASIIEVTLNVAGANASFPFAAQALKGPKVLAAEEFPEIRFTSSKIRAEGEGARVEGQITIRGITRPIVLFAQFWQQSGQEAGDLRLLKIRLTGSLLRSEFGATGWSDMVGDEVRLDILALIEREGG
jgi:polyisoprenoid-binding protein YceI